MKGLNTIFMGTPAYVMPSLNLLYEHTSLKAVFTGLDKRGGRGNKPIIPEPKQFASLNEIPCYQFTNLKDKAIIDIISDLEPDIIVVNAYGFILPEAILAIPRMGAINLHASLLPKYRGASPIQSTLVNGDKKTGISVQLMSARLDAGDIIYAKETDIKDHEDYNSLYNRLSFIAADCLLHVIKLYRDNSVVYEAQDDKKASYCKKIQKTDGIINWDSPYRLIEQKIRAYINWPKSYTYYKGQKLIIDKITKDKKLSLGQLGEIVSSDRTNGILVQCGDSLAKLLSLKLEGKKLMDYKSFLNGHSLDKGHILGLFCVYIIVLF